MNLEFRELNAENWKACAQLTLKEEDEFVASNTYSIAEAQFYPKAISRAIFSGDEMIGYAMYGEDEDDSEVWAIDRFMISRSHRRRGYGSEALRRILDFGRAKGFTKFVTSTALKNHPMQELLSKVGFEMKHEIRDGEYLFFREENGAQQDAAGQPATRCELT